jgi:hypothetical protein
MIHRYGEEDQQKHPDRYLPQGIQQFCPHIGLPKQTLSEICHINAGVNRTTSTSEADL